MNKKKLNFIKFDSIKCKFMNSILSISISNNISKKDVLKDY